MKIGLIGLGDIATKAYLPVIGRKEHEVHLFTRDAARLMAVSNQYRFPRVHSSLHSLIESGIEAAFVHTSTSSHFAIVSELLENNIHVYVDKPLTYHFDTTEKLVSRAESRNLVLQVGFNRRYAPAYAQLRGLPDTNMIVMQKNRRSLPGDVRTFIFDDFIHVVDTLLYLFPGQITGTRVSGRQAGGQLYHVVVQLDGADGTTAIGIMNRDSGTVEEQLEVFTAGEKWVVRDVAEAYVFRDGHATRQKVSDWESTLSRRGFEQITEAFLQSVAKGSAPPGSHQDLLRTHQLCEQVVTMLSPVQ